MNSTLQTGLMVLGRLLAAGGPRGVCELARDLGKEKSNIHRVLATLSAHGFVDRDSDTRKYRLDPGWAQQAGQAKARSPRRAEAAWWVKT
jgi:DNA-binding IclR family transcriptional regulator